MPGSYSVQLPTENQGKSIVGPQGNRGGFLGGLADAASNFINADVHRTGQARQMSDEARQADVRAALNEEARGVVKSYARANDSMHPDTPVNSVGVSNLPDIPGTNVATVPTDTTTPAGFENGSVPSDVAQAGAQLQSVRTAVNQGRQPSSALDLHLENVINETMARHPEASAEILQFFHSQGFDHYLYQDVQAQLAGQEADTAAAQASTTYLARQAVELGLGTPQQYSQQQLAAMALPILHARALQQATTERYNGIIAQHNAGHLSQEDEDHARTSNARDAVQAQMLIADNYASRLSSQIAILAANPDPTVQARLGALGTGYAAAITVLENNAVAAVDSAGGSATDLAAVHARYQNYMASYSRIFTGDASQVAINGRAYQSLITNWRLDGAHAAQTYGYLSTVFGQGAVNQLLSPNGTLALPANIQQRLATEMHNFNMTNDPNAATAILGDVARLLAGNASLQQMPEAQAARTMPALLPGARANMADVHQAMVNRQPVDPTSLSNALNGASQVIDASTSFTPGTHRIESVEIASNFLGNGDLRDTLTAGLANPATHDRAVGLMQGSRAAAARLQEIGKGEAATAHDASGVQRVEFFHGRWDVTVTRQRYQQYLRTFNQNNTAPVGMGGRLGTGAPITPPTYEQIAAHRDIHLVQLATALNDTGQHLAETMQYDADPTLHRLTPQQARAYYAVGQLPPDIAAARHAQVAAANETDQQLNRLEQDVRTLPAQLATNPQTRQDAPQSATQYLQHVSPAAERYGIPEQGAVRMFSQESQWDPHANAHVHFPNSHAVGLGQLQPDVARHYGLHVHMDEHGNPLPDDDRLNPALNIDASLHYLHDLYEQNGHDWARALDAYSGHSHSSSVRAHILEGFAQSQGR